MLDKRLKGLVSQPWIKKLFTYLDDKNQQNYRIVINKFTYKSIKYELKPNILELLKIHLDEIKEDLESAETLFVEKGELLIKLNALIKIVKRGLEYQSNHNGKLSKGIKYALRRGFCIDEYGKSICDNFFKQIQEIDVFDGNVGLLFNHYTSLINIIEIYQQVDTQITVDFSFYWNNGTVVRLSELVLYGNYYDKDFRNIIVEKKDSSLVLDIIKRICLFNYLGDEITVPRKLTIYWIDYKKELMTIRDDKDRLFTSSEINTGVTNGVEIIITRKEECLITILHECCHLYDWDFKIVPKELSKWFLDLFPIRTTLEDYKGEETLNLFEAYTEWFASIVEIAFRYYPIGGEGLFLEEMNKQVVYTVNKCCQILKISNCENIYQFIKNNKGGCVIQQSTNVFSYFVLKLFFYWRCDMLLECLNEEGKFIKTGPNFEVIKTITEKCIKSVSLLDFINSVDNKDNDMLNANKSGKNIVSLKMVK